MIETLMKICLADVHDLAQCLDLGDNQRHTSKIVAHILLSDTCTQLFTTYRNLTPIVSLWWILNLYRQSRLRCSVLPAVAPWAPFLMWVGYIVPQEETDNSRSLTSWVYKMNNLEPLYISDYPHDLFNNNCDWCISSSRISHTWPYEEAAEFLCRRITRRNYQTPGTSTFWNIASQFLHWPNNITNIGANICTW